jgi:hypothetical protein
MAVVITCRGVVQVQDLVGRERVARTDRPSICGATLNAAGDSPLGWTVIRDDGELLNVFLSQAKTARSARAPETGSDDGSL